MRRTLVHDASQTVQGQEDTNSKAPRDLFLASALIQTFKSDESGWPRVGFENQSNLTIASSNP